MKTLAAALVLALPLAAQQEAAAPAKALEPELLALFDYDREADLDIQENGVETFDGYSRIDLTYASPAGGRVPAYLFEPEGPENNEPYAGIVLMHGMPGDRTNGASLAGRYVKAGAMVLAISAPWARPDGPREDILTMTPTDRDEQIQLIQDLRRGVDLLQSFPWVDPERIGYVGGSYGGAMGGLLAGVEERVKAYVLMVGDGGLVAHFTSADDPQPPDGVTEEQWQSWKEAMLPIEPMRFVAHAKAPLLFQNGKVDQMVPPADAKQYQEAACEPKTVKWYEGGHSITGEMLADQHEWLAKHIGIAAP